ncbi:RNA polymerase sigma factor [Paenarthrobacter histidinolovorans]|uniref:RNA polymerase sigma factor n=1 Tax=Paenarthrobacter histidinolovorans TaxID=43664 RepID=UPI001E395658|nr:sigma-70 family RNA polymerase sigma factor [Paenarthrobacter histidinolovorans]
MEPFASSRTLQVMGNMGSQDAGLWARSLAGDGAAFGALFDRHRDRVFRHAYRLCGNRHTSEDILATAFLELWKKRRKVVLVEHSILPWLLVTTTNVARNTNRASTRYRRMLDSLPRQDEAQVDSGEATYFQSVLDQDVVDALKTLGSIDLHLISLVVFEEYSVNAAAELLNLSPAAAKSRMHRARSKIKDVLQPKPAPPSQFVMEGNGS